MTREIQTKFYTFRQNNSGGYFIQNADLGIGVFMIIEAQNKEEAITRRDKIGEKQSNFHDFCPCCGERWSDYVDDECEEQPLIYDKPVELFKDEIDYDKTAYVHYYDGTFKDFSRKGKKQ